MATSNLQLFEQYVQYYHGFPDKKKARQNIDVSGSSK